MAIPDYGREYRPCCYAGFWAADQLMLMISSSDISGNTVWQAKRNGRFLIK